MKLYFAPFACSMAPHLALKASGLAYELVQVDADKAALDPAFLKLNPMGAVPVLELDNGEALTEGVAILQFVADQVPGKELIPANGTWERVRAQEWLNFIATELHGGFGPLFAGDTMMKSPEAKTELRAAAMSALKKTFSIADAKLAGREYALGDRLSIVDFYLFTVLNWAPFMKIDTDSWPHLHAFVKRMKAMPVVQTVLAEEGDARHKV